MRSFRAVVWSTGITGGALFAINASFPRVHGWPMLWPAVAGAAAFWLATRGPGPHRLRTGLAAAFLAGVIAGAIAFLTTAIFVVGLVRTAVHPTVAQTGVSSGFVTSVGLIGLATLGVVSVIVAVLGGVVLLPLRYIRMRRMHA